MSDATIFCARCGASGQKTEAYCRSCGEWLPAPAAGRLGPGRLRGVSPEGKQRRIYLLQLLSALAAAVAGVIALAVLLFGLHRDVLLLTALLCFVVVAWQVVASFLGRSIQSRRSQELAGGNTTLPAAQGQGRPALSAADTGNLVRPPSVTENTTALLDRQPLKRDSKK